MNLYFLQLITSKSCNQKCYYCNVYEPIREVVIDIDFLKFVLDCCPFNTGIEFTGGEVGLISNLDETFKTIYDHKNIKHIIALSNGMLRKRNVDWLDKVEYWEHLVFDILPNKDIMRFYDLELEPINDRHKIVIVTTETTTNSLISNWEYFKELGMFRPHFFYKLMNHKTHTISSYFDKVYILFKFLNDKFSMRMIDEYIYKMKHSKFYCTYNSPNPFVDFDTKEIGHCAVSIPDSQRMPFSKENLQMQMEGRLFPRYNPSYCENCYVYDNGKDKPEYLTKSKNGIYCNRSYKQ